MSFQLYIARLKCIIRNKQVLFWNYIFPILLATCYYFAFSNLYSAESFETIKVAYDNEGAKTDEFGTVISQAKLSDDTRMFDITYCDKAEAKTLLEKGKIEAYIVGSVTPQLFVKENGMNETIVKAFMDSYLQMQATVHSILQKNPNAVNEGLIDDVMQYDNYVGAEKNQKNPDSLLIYFYSLLAFACVYAASSGLDEVINIQADQSACGARVNVSPVQKMRLFLCNLLASFTSHIFSIMILFAYLYFILKINFGNSLFYLFLICFLGSLAGLAMGATVGVWVKKKAEVKEAILTLLVLGGSFLAGMMVSNMKYMIEEKFPLLGYINPVNLVSDAMYSLYYFDTYDRFYRNAAVLCVITIILVIASYVGIRRKTYASI